MTDYKTALRTLIAEDDLPKAAERAIGELGALGLEVLGWRAAVKHGGCEPEDMLTDQYLSLHSRPPVAETLHVLTIVSRGPGAPGEVADDEVTKAVARGLGDVPWTGTTTRIADGDAVARELMDTVGGVAVDMDGDGRVCGIRVVGE